MRLQERACLATGANDNLCVVENTARHARSCNVWPAHNVTGAEHLTRNTQDMQNKAPLLRVAYKGGLTTE